MHKGFAELAHITRKGEDYELKASFFINNESLLVGSSSKVLVRP